MTKRELKRSIRFLKYYGRNPDGDIINIFNGDTMILVNGKMSLRDRIKYGFNLKHFVGRAICEVAEAVAKELGKEVQWWD